jgi:hypothetical protein
MKHIEHQKVTQTYRVNKSVDPMFKLWITFSYSQLLASLSKTLTDYPHETYYLFLQFFVAGAMANLLSLPAVLKEEKPEQLEERVWAGLRAAYTEGFKTMNEYDLSQKNYWIRSDIVSRASSFYWVCVASKKIKFPENSDMHFYRPFTDPAF